MGNFKDIQEARRQGRLEVLRAFNLTERDFELRLKSIGPRAVTEREPQLAFDFGGSNGVKLQR